MSSLRVEGGAEPIDQAAGDLKIRLFPRQALAYTSVANEQLFGGAKGGGKSGYIRMAFVLWCMLAPGLQCALFRRHWNELYGNHMEGPHSFPDILAPMVNKGQVAITAHHIRFWNGSHIQLGHLQLAKSAYNYSGLPIQVMGFDEATQLEDSQYKFLVYTVMRLGKWSPPRHMLGMFPRAISGANPGGPSHAFFKNGFVDNGPYEIVRAEKKDGGMYRQFIPARAEDNPALIANDPTYLDRLEGSGDPALVQALREGDWTVVAGAMYGEVWRATKFGRPWHVHPGFPIPATWPLWRGGDDGFEKPSAIYWLTEDPDYGTIYVIDEVYKNHMLPHELAEEIKEHDFGIAQIGAFNAPGFNRERLKGAYDSSAFTDTGESDKNGQKQITRGEQMNRLGCRWVPVQKWPGSRAARAQNLHRLLRANPKAPPMRVFNGSKIEVVLDRDGKPMLEHDRPGIVFFARCTNAIRTIPQLARDEGNPEQVADNAEDHGYDGVTYGVQFRRGRTKIVDLGGL